MTDKPTTAKRLVFLVGAPHSGVNWLRLLLSQHPHVVSCGETRLFSDYLQPFLAGLQGPPTATNGQARDGLLSVLSDAEYRRLVSSLSRTVFAKVAQRKPAARVLLESSPEHGGAWRRILALYPSARFIHIIRDPRTALADVKSTWQERHNGEGPWRGVVEQTRSWCEQVESVRELVDDSRRCLEVRYETLQTKPADTFLEMLRWLDLPADLDQCIGVTSALAKRSANGHAVPWAAPEDPEAALGGPMGWMTTLTAREQACVERVAQDLMIRYQYEAGGTAAERRGRLAVWAHQVFEDIEKRAHAVRQRL